jgi:hypothetical protein
MFEGLPFSRVSFRRRTRLERWPRKTLRACLTPSGGGRSLKGSSENSLRSSPFCRLEGASCALP